MKKLLVIIAFMSIIPLLSMNQYSLISNQVDLNDQLYHAVQSGQAQKIEELLRQGANPQGNKEKNPLACAVKTSKRECVQVLLAYGADPNFQTSPLDATALYYAAIEPSPGKFLIVQDLIAAGANPNTRRNRDKERETPLDAAVRTKNIKVITLLADHCTPEVIAQSLAITCEEGDKKNSQNDQYKKIIKLLKPHLTLDPLNEVVGNKLYHRKNGKSAKKRK